MTVKTPEPPALPAEVDRLLRRLRIPYVRRAAPEVIATATAQRWEPSEVLRVLLSEEAKGRDEATIRMRRRQSGLPAGKTFDALATELARQGAEVFFCDPATTWQATNLWPRRPSLTRLGPNLSLVRYHHPVPHRIGSRFAGEVNDRVMGRRLRSIAPEGRRRILWVAGRLTPSDAPGTRISQRGVRSLWSPAARAPGCRWQPARAPQAPRPRPR